MPLLRQQTGSGSPAPPLASRLFIKTSGAARFANEKQEKRKPSAAISNLPTLNRLTSSHAADVDLTTCASRRWRDTVFEEQEGTQGAHGGADQAADRFQAWSPVNNTRC